MLTDSFGRKHDYLRISLTDACNLRCVYCMPSEDTSVTPSARLMQADEIEGIARVFTGLGVKKIRLTGGEPLLRKDVRLIMQKLSALPVELTISTNAILANEFIGSFHEAGIKSANVSLDTLNPEEFKAITKRGDFEKIKSNIALLLTEGLRVKVNVVIMKGINEHVVPDFIRWTKDHELDVRFIEFMPFAGNSWRREAVVPYAEILGTIRKSFDIIKLQDQPNDTAKKYAVKGYRGSFAFITTVTEPFCDSCNRLRLTADGKIKNCLFSSTENDILSAWRAGKDIRPLIALNLGNKKKERGGRFDFENIDNRSMIRIGG
ncbi:MAG: GTP 3',8-cyclase MoaA [Bacteroidia bacterium]